MLEALANRKRAEVLDLRFNAAMVTAAIVNSAGGNNSKAVSPFDLMPEDYRPKPETDFEETPEQFERRKALWNSAMLEARAVNHLKQRLT